MDEETVRFTDYCDKCGARLREFNRNVESNKYPKMEWVPEYHELPDCIRYLVERIEKLENK